MIVEQAKKEEAAIVVQDWTALDTNELLLKVIERVGFHGPLVTVRCSVFNASTPSEANHGGTTIFYRAKKTFEEDNFAHKRSAIFRRVTHVFLVNHDCADQLTHARMTGVIARALSGHCRHNVVKEVKLLKHGGGPKEDLVYFPEKTLCGVLVNGGRLSLHTVGEHVRQGIPYLVLQGSGRLSDYLPIPYVKRLDATFDSQSQFHQASE